MRLPTSRLRQLAKSLAGRRARHTEANVRADLHILSDAGSLDLGEGKIQSATPEFPVDRRESNAGERALLFLNTASLAIGLPLAILQGRPSSAIIVLIILGCGFASALVYIWRKRLPSGRRKYRRLRWGISTIAIMIASGVAVMGAVPVSRPVFLYDILGFQRPFEVIDAGQLGLALSDSYIRILVPVTNSSANSMQLNRMELNISWTSPVLCAGPPVFEFSLQNHLYVQAGKDGRAVSGSMNIESGAASGFNVPVTGEASGFCDNGTLVLRFTPPVLILERSSTGIISFNLPRNLRVSETVTVAGYSLKSHRREPHTSHEDIKLDMASLVIPSIGNRTSVMVEFSAATESGSTITACEKTGESNSDSLTTASNKFSSCHM